MASGVVGRGTWIDKLAGELVRREKRLGRSLGLIRVESGLGASGIPHIGSLGDAVRAYGVKLSLEDQGYGSELVAYADDMDGLRKIPHGFPDSLAKYLAEPVSAIPDPYGVYESYGARMSGLLLEGLDNLGIRYKFQSAKQAYGSGLFQRQIHAILCSSASIGQKISEMVGQDKFRNILPYFAVCEKCGRLYTTRSTEYISDERVVVYHCGDATVGTTLVAGCGHNGHSKISRDPGKLAWKVEFAARWQALDIRFEAYGKDIMDSVRVNDWISDNVLDFPHPHHIRYEMFLDRGGKKISKSSGNVVTPQQWLRYGTPESILLLLYKRISGARSVGLEDIPSLMDEYNYLEDIYFKVRATGSREKDIRYRGLYQYANLLRPPKTPGPHIGYRLLVELCRIFYEERRSRVTSKLIDYGVLQDDSTDIGYLIDLAGNYADDFDKLQKTEADIDGEMAAVLASFADLLMAADDPADIQSAIFDVARSSDVPPRRVFRALYQIILGTDRGPRLGPFIEDVGRHRVGRLILDRVSSMID